MLAADLALIDLDGEHWARWQTLFRPHALGGLRWAVLFVDGGQVIKAIEGGRGALDPAAIGFRGTGAGALAALRAQLGLGALIVLEMAALPELFAEAERELDGGADYVAQWLTIVRAVKRRAGRGLHVDPPVLDMIPAPGAEGLQRTFDLLVPDDTSLIAYVFEDDGAGVHTSIIGVKRAGDIALATTHLALAATVDGPALAREWRTRYPRVLRAVSQRFARPSLAAFLDRATFRRLVAGPPEQLYRELTAKNLILDPAPAWLLGLIGGATVAGVAGRSAKALARFLPAGARRMAGELAQQAQGALRDSSVGPFALLGFDPIALWLYVRGALVESPG